jgi:hypothetical protein
MILAYQQQVGRIYLWNRLVDRASTRDCFMYVFTQGN